MLRVITNRNKMRSAVKTIRNSSSLSLKTKAIYFRQRFNRTTGLKTAFTLRRRKVKFYSMQQHSSKPWRRYIDRSERFSVEAWFVQRTPQKNRTLLKMQKPKTSNFECLENSEIASRSKLYLLCGLGISQILIDLLRLLYIQNKAKPTIESVKAALDNWSKNKFERASPYLSLTKIHVCYISGTCMKSNSF